MKRTTFFVVALVVAFALAFGVSRFASSSPDGLERVAADKALDSNEKPHTLANGPFADYATSGIEDPGTSTGLAGVVGVVVTFVVAGGLVGIAMWTSRRREVAGVREDAASVT